MSMRNATPIKNEEQFSALVKAAQEGPVTIERQNRELAVMLSIDEYERMRGMNLEEIRKLGSQISAEAVANGLNPEILDRLRAVG